MIGFLRLELRRVDQVIELGARAVLLAGLVAAVHLAAGLW